MKIGFLIHNLHSGGAERQIVELAKGVKALGHDVAVCVYSPGKFFEPELHQAGIPVIELSPSGYWQKFSLVYGWLRKWNPHVLQAFLPGPNVLAELTTLLPHTWKVVVSERILDPTFDLTSKFLRHLHRRADWVTTNSYANMDQLLLDLPYLKGKSSVIWNMVDLERFVLANPKPKQSDDGIVRFLCVAGLRAQKNGPKLLEALHQLRNRGIENFHVRWVGMYRPEVSEQAQMYQEMFNCVEKYKLKKHFAFVGEKKDMVLEYNSVDALVLVSLFEGLPNVACEAMACQLPVVLSNIADNAKIVGESGAGFLCVPHDSQSIANAMERMINLSEGERHTMGRAARRFSENHFTRERLIEGYTQTYQVVCNGNSTGRAKLE